MVYSIGNKLVRKLPLCINLMKGTGARIHCNGINYKGDNSVYHRPWGVFLLGVSCWFRGGSFGFLLMNTIVSSRGFGHFLCDIIWVKVSLCSGIDCNMHSLKSKMLRWKIKYQKNLLCHWFFPFLIGNLHMYIILLNSPFY